MRQFEGKKPPIVRLPPKSDAEIVLARAAQVALIFIGVIALIFALNAGRYILAPVALAIVFGLMVGPIAGMMERRGVNPWVSSALVFLLLVSGLFSLAYALSGPVAFWLGQIPVIWEDIQFQLSQLRRPLEALQGLRDELRQVTGEGGGFTVAVDEGSPVENVAWLAPAFLAQLLLFMGSLYFFVATRHNTRQAVLRLCVERRLRWRIAHVFRDIETLVSRYLLSIAAINFALGLAVMLALWLVGVPSPALWGALAGLLNFIIYIGPAVMVAILFIVGLATFDTLSGSLMPPLVYLAVNMIEAQFVTPLVVGRTLTLNPFAVLLALSFWIWLWGPVGGFIAIPAVLVLIALARNLVPGAAGAVLEGRPRHRPHLP